MRTLSLSLIFAATAAACSGSDADPPGGPGDPADPDAGAPSADANAPGEPDASTLSCTSDWCLVPEAPYAAWDLSVTPSGIPWIVSYGAYTRNANGWRHHDVKWDDLADPFVVHNELYAVHAFSATDVWVGGRQGYLGHFNGSSWTEHRPAAPWPQGIWGAATDDVWMLYDSGLRYHFDGEEVASQPTSQVHHNGAWGTSATDVWGFGDGPTGAGNGRAPALDHFDGESWQMTLLPGEGWIIAFWKSSDEDLWAIRSAGFGATALLHGDGDSWEEVEGMSGIGLLDVWGRAADDVWAVGRQGTILHFDGATWTTSPSGTTEDLTRIRGTATTLWVGGTGVALVSR